MDLYFIVKKSVDFCYKGFYIGALNEMNFNFNEVIIQLTVMILIILIGYLAKRIKILNNDGDKMLSSLIIYITSPSLVIYSITNMTEAKVVKNIFIIVLIYAISMLFIYLIPSKIVLLMPNLSSDEKTIYRFAVAFGNTGFIGFPMCYALFGNIGLFYASIVTAVNDIFLWTFGVKLMSGITTKRKLSSILNPVIIATFIGILCHILGIRLPVFAQKTFSTLGNANTPLAFLVIGSSIYGIKQQLITIKRMLLPTLLKMIVIPLFATLIIANIPGIDQIVKNVLLIELSMPCASSVVIMSQIFNRDYRLASQAVVFMILASIVTLPLMALIIQ